MNTHLQKINPASNPFMLHGKSKYSVQPKLTVNTPGDIYEQEADAMADRVMRMSSNEVTKPVTGLIGKSLQRKCAHCEEEEKGRKPIMRKAVTGNSGIAVSSSFASSLNASKGSGSPLPKGIRDFMENAFSTDFSSVKIHTGSKASDMSKGINAKAFTYGNNIYFNEGQYNAESTEGRRLLAHELTHVGQQSSDKIQRRISFVNPIPTEKDPLQLVLGEKKLGKTYASFNQNVLQDGNFSGARRIIGMTLIPSKLTLSKNGSIFTAIANTADIDVRTSAKMETITSSTNNAWKGFCPPLPIPRRFSAICAGNPSIEVEMTGFPNLHSTVLRHENEHWTDIKSLTNSEITPAHDLILGLSGTGNSEANAQIDWDDKLNQNAQPIIDKINSFLTKLVAANQVYDGPGGSHYTNTTISTDRNCSKIWIKP